MQAAAPYASIPAAKQGRCARMKSHYHFIEQPPRSVVTPRNILTPHCERMLRRMQGPDALLCLHDGTDLNFARTIPAARTKNRCSKGTSGGPQGWAGAARALDAGAECRRHSAGRTTDTVRRTVDQSQACLTIAGSRSDRC